MLTKICQGKNCQFLLIRLIFNQNSLKHKPLTKFQHKKVKIVRFLPLAYVLLGFNFLEQSLIHTVVDHELRLKVLEVTFSNWSCYRKHKNTNDTRWYIMFKTYLVLWFHPANLLTGGSTFNCWTNVDLWRCNFETLLWIVYRWR